jgi:hypothetical protein
MKKNPLTTEKEVKEIIIKLQENSDNKCGISFVYLNNFIKINRVELILMLNKLHNDKFIRVREGINNKLIFLKKWEPKSSKTS